MFCGKVLILLSAAFNLNLADGWHMIRSKTYLLDQPIESD